MKQSCILFPIIIITFVLFSCHKEEDIPPALTLDKEANMTIAELLSLYTVNNAYSYVEIPDSTVICGIVTSSDKEQNCYKYLTLRTSARATFAGELLPAGRCNLKGILVNSSSGPLLYLRSLEDVEQQ